MFLRETNWLAVRRIEPNMSGFRLWYAVKKIISRVEIIAGKHWKRIVGVKSLGDRVIDLKFQAGHETSNIISAYMLSRMKSNTM